MVDTSFDTVFAHLNLVEEPSFYPQKGFEDTRGSETYTFYVVTSGRVPGIYTHWEDACLQVNKFPSASHKKYSGWSAATSALDATRRPSMPAAVSPSTPATSTPALKKSSVATMKASASISAPSTPSGRKKKMLYVYSRGTGTTIYANQQQASSAARRGLADGSFRKVDLTTSTGDAFDIASESALEVYNISDIESDAEGA
ncbi:hypothetical protein DFH08DRAFT_978998 [Mycena albidolilacea]|uniref:Ribonuclease H1 N-terminal domain-containing protein n=1 Tax=Mycena albidolilacea TaxID=1033008 RepID=A0AAD7E6S2_9AGAR|nr:hypothetical protein DFH08DRAFT_978998 [Mycena albidolilacea]